MDCVDHLSRISCLLPVLSVFISCSPTQCSFFISNRLFITYQRSIAPEGGDVGFYKHLGSYGPQLRSTPANNSLALRGGEIPCNPCHPRSIFLSPNFRSQLPVLLPALPSRGQGWQRWQRL